MFLLASSHLYMTIATVVTLRTYFVTSTNGNIVDTCNLRTVKSITVEEYEERRTLLVEEFGCGARTFGKPFVRSCVSLLPHECKTCQNFRHGEVESMLIF